MKKLFLTGLMVVALARLTHAQSATFENNGLIDTPTNIDAIRFINNATFDIAFNTLSLTNSNGQINGSYLGAFFFTTEIKPFEFSDVLYYTNRGTMSCDTGFLFDDAPATTGFRQMADTFGNANTGRVLAGSANSSFTTSLVFFAGPGLTFFSGIPQLKIYATNVVNTGYLDVGSDGLLDIQGSSVNLSRGTVHVEGFDDTNITTLISDIGIQDQYWGFGMQTNVLAVLPGANFPFPGNLAVPYPASPLNNVTNTAGFPTFSYVAPSPYGVAYANVTLPNPSNTCVQVVYVNTNLQNIATDVRFMPGGSDFGTPIIQWQATVTNYLGVLGQSVTTNNLYLTDIYGSQPTNYLITNEYTFSGTPQPAPYNYTFYRSFPGFATIPQGNTPFTTVLYQNAFPATNAYAAYGVDVTPVSAFPDPMLPGSTVTNTPGRIQINASTVMDLTRSKITGPNYLNLTSPNHFAGAENAEIISPYMDLNLGSTNGLLSISNVVAPNVPRFTGPIDMWSGRWTNVDSTGMTNTFDVLIVNAQLSATALPQVLNCQLRAPTVVVSDALNIEQSLLINANNLLITSNGPYAPTTYGAINIVSSDILWSSSLPVLQTVTNYGLIACGNTTYFESIHTTPYYPSNSIMPYTSFVNHGLVTSSGSQIRANYFENTGAGLIITNYSGIATTTNQSALIFSDVGPIVLQTGPALMLNGGIVAAAGDLNLTNSSLTISNHALLTSGELTLAVSGPLTDTGTQSSNFWSVGDGMNLLVKPASGDLLGTTITNTAPPGVEVYNTWAANDVGASTSGFVNNAALGHLILDGGDGASQFYFGGPDTSRNYAIYVDELELRDGATNRVPENGIETFTTFDVAPNFTIYYADATMSGGLDISEKLNGADGGRLVWVSGYAGAFSSTNIAYPGGSSYAYNRALAQSTDIDSNGNGVANAFDPTPFFVPQNVNLSLNVTNKLARASVVTNTSVLKWNALANSTNYIYFKNSVSGTNWTLVTNFVQGPTNGTVTFTDKRTNAAGFYKVQLTPQQP